MFHNNPPSFSIVIACNVFSIVKQPEIPLFARTVGVFGQQNLEGLFQRENNIKCFSARFTAGKAKGCRMAKNIE